MRGLGTATEDEVVLAFLRAEIDSPKWGPEYSRALDALGLSRASLIDDADLEDAFACDTRKVLLGAVRGYSRDEALFTGFPGDTTWRRVQIEPSDFHRLKSISKDRQWTMLTGGTRLIQEAARSLDAYPERAAGIRDTMRRIEQGLLVAELILVESDSGDLILVEGHTRATAYAVLSDRAFSAFVGTSPLMYRWHFV